MEKYPFELSGGMAQRLSIAMAVAPSPQLIIADEPIVSLDEQNRQKSMNLLVKLIKESNTSLLLITHDLSLALSIADYVAIMYAGQVVEYADCDHIQKYPMHPYTKLLFQLFREVNQKDTKLPCRYTDPPDPTALGEGCPFFPGCPQTILICESRLPDAVPTGSESFVRCFCKGESN
ncbi:Oligopeptide transport ATP-binding protein OppD [bioreactor metagenome]|uniref:Oligopeptide transport ATP-binding protein OppD n=1 Tax=bioreactor metagenome TaxID=1076179 RepID=A0A645G1N0_9ZZZZ